MVTLHQAGFDNAVASMGTALTVEQTRLLSRYTKELVLCYDNDNAGQLATQRALDILKNSEFTVRVLQLPRRLVDGSYIKQDADDFIKLQGPAAFERLLTGSENGVEFRLDQIAGKYDLTDDTQRIAYAQEVSEELAKLLPVRLAAWDHPAFDYRFDAVVYSVSSALGFAAVENILYVLQSDLRTAVSRAILSVPGHFFFAVSMGLLLSRAKQAECCGQLRRRRVMALLALAVPTLLHGLWDFLLAAGSRWAVIAFYAFVAAFFITADVCLRRASRTDSRL